VTTGAAYDRIGVGYAQGRRTDPRVAAAIWDGLADAQSVLNVGAGTGNYEPTDRRVTSVEPSKHMIEQRPDDAAPVVRAVAEALPVRDSQFDATLCVLTLHHWSDLRAGLAELRRVADRQVILMFDADLAHGLWLIDEYYPEILDLPTEQRAPSVIDVGHHLDVRDVRAVPVPADCIDGFAGAYWNRPEAYLDPAVRRAMSCFAALGDEAEARGTAALRADLESGRWDERHGHLRALGEMDLGYRLVIAGS
jgi:SAM-dependent methyltransferase